MSKVAVFGGSGFLGLYLVEELIVRGHEVLVADINPLDPLLAERAAFVFCDILDKEQINQVFKFGIDAVYNLAGFANLDEAVDQPTTTIELNILGNANVIEAATSAGVQRYVYASSAYAMSSIGSFYGISKLSSEKIVEEYQKRYGLSYTILRYGSVYAESDFENNYIFTLVKSIVKEGVVHHSGDGNEVREYIHAVDAARLSVDVMEQEEFANKHVVLTGHDRLRRVELFKMIEEILGKPLEVQMAEERSKSHYQLTPYSFQPTFSVKLVANPHIDIGQGLLRCINKVHEQLS